MYISIILIIAAISFIVLIIKFLIRRGVFYLYIEIDTRKEVIYGWHKWKIIHSQGFNLNIGPGRIKLMAESVKAVCENKISQINQTRKIKV